MGGAIFGGAVGAAGGLVSAVIEDATGKDVIGNAIALAGINENKAYEDLPANLLAFAQTPMPEYIEENNDERVEIASGRTAGTIAFYA